MDRWSAAPGLSRTVACGPAKEDQVGADGYRLGPLVPLERVGLKLHSRKCDEVALVDPTTAVASGSVFDGKAWERTDNRQDDGERRHVHVSPRPAPGAADLHH